jgi:pimeloyl-ACP methyl ester carboxylesterase
VCDLTDWPGIDGAAGAYGLTPEELRKQLSAHNPIERLAPLAAARVPILHLHGDADTVIPLDRHSAELARRYRDLGGRIELVVVPGIGHEEVSAFFESQRLVDFLTKHH